MSDDNELANLELEAEYRADRIGELMRAMRNGWATWRDAIEVEEHLAWYEDQVAELMRRFN